MAGGSASLSDVGLLPAPRPRALRTTSNCDLSASRASRSRSRWRRRRRPRCHSLEDHRCRRPVFGRATLTPYEARQFAPDAIGQRPYGRGIGRHFYSTRSGPTDGSSARCGADCAASSLERWKLCHIAIEAKRCRAANRFTHRRRAHSSASAAATAVRFRQSVPLRVDWPHCGLQFATMASVGLDRCLRAMPRCRRALRFRVRRANGRARVARRSSVPARRLRSSHGLSRPALGKQVGHRRSLQPPRAWRSCDSRVRPPIRPSSAPIILDPRAVHSARQPLGSLLASSTPSASRYGLNEPFASRWLLDRAPRASICTEGLCRGHALPTGPCDHSEPSRSAR